MSSASLLSSVAGRTRSYGGRLESTWAALPILCAVATRLSGSNVSAVQLAERLKLIGADPEDDEDLRARKALLVLISVLILPVAGLWAALYLSFHSPVGWAPGAYFVVLAGSVAVFSRTRNFLWLLRVGQISILFAPTLSMI